MANIKFAENVRSQIDDAIQKGAKALINTKEVFPNDKVSLYIPPITRYTQLAVHRLVAALFLLKF